MTLRKTRKAERAADGAALVEVCEGVQPRMEFAVAALDAGAFEMDNENRRFWCSPEFVRLTGRRMTFDEAFSPTWPIHHPDDVERVRETLAAAYAAEADRLMIESRVLLPDGGARWLEWRLKALRDERGRLIGSVGLVFDIDHRKRQEAELIEARRIAQESAERLEVAVMTAGAGVFHIEMAPRSLWLSPAVNEIVGRQLVFEDIVTPVWTVCHPDDAERVYKAATNFTNSGLAPIEWRLIRPDGEIRWVETHGRVYFNETGQVSRVIGVIVDINERKRQEAALLDSRREAQGFADRLKMAMIASRAGVFETNFRTETFWCSPEFEQIVGRKLAFEDVRTPDWPIIYPPDRERVLSTIKSNDNVMLRSVEWRVLLPSGETRWVESNGLIYRHPDGSLERITGTIVDIDERKRQQAELLSSRRQAQANAERMNLALASARAGVFEIDVASKTFWCSPEFEQIAGRMLTYQETNRPAWANCHPDDIDRVTHRIRSGRAAAIEPLEWRLIRPNGEVRWVETTGRTYVDAEGRVYRVVGIIVDIDERKRQQITLDQARQALQANAERLTLALAASQAGVFETDIVNRTSWCSPEFVEIVGRPLTFEETLSPWPMTHPDDAAVIGTMIANGGSHAEWRIILPSGAIRWVEGRVTLNHDAQGNLTKVVGVVLDIDERKRQELILIEAEQAALAAGEAKSQFLANMSHEIRTPMNGVLGILNLLNREPLSDEARRMVAEAEGCGQMLAQLLDDVIDLSKIDAGRLELSPIPTDAAALLNSVADLLRPQANAKGVDLVVQIEGGDGWAVVDPVRLRQGLFNLLGNAIKFTPQGRVAARLAISHREGELKRLRFEIQDTGVGIPAAAQAILFQRFQQADGSTARRFGGSGLGLAITRAVAEMMGGEVGFTSVEGEGSTFWLDVSAPASAPPVAADDEGPTGLEGISILVVEDNATNRLVATKILEGLGAEVQTAVDGIDGVEAVQRQAFDLVLMDVQMPRMDGVEATRTIRALPGPEARIPIVGLTANVMLHQWTAYREAGMDGVASKPISPAVLLGEIVRVLSGAEADPNVAAA